MKIAKIKMKMLKTNPVKHDLNVLKQSTKLKKSIRAIKAMYPKNVYHPYVVLSVIIVTIPETIPMKTPTLVNPKSWITE